MHTAEIASQALRFVGVGAANTLFTLALYQVLIFIVPYKIAYTLSFAAGILFAALVNSRIVFSTRLTGWTAFRFTVTYVVLYLMGFYITIGLVEVAHVPVRIAPIATVVLLLPISFLASRYALLNPRAKDKGR